MSAHDPLDELLSVWEDAAERGEDLPAVELCRNRPELLPDLERRIRNLQRMNRLLRSAETADGPEAQGVSTLPPAGAGEQTQTPHPQATGTPGSRPGLFLADYEIQEELGRGGMGVVYKARDLRLKRTVAVKQLLLASQAMPDRLARFRAEAEAIARLKHPHIVQIYQAGEHDGQPFFILEYVPGGSLDGKLPPGQPQPIRDSVRLVMLLARAMHAAHQAGVVHRDLKPANVLLDAPADEPALNTLWGRPKVTDFGLARLCDTEGNATVSGAVMGTPCYMAPEQAEGHSDAIGPAADQWALGVLLYELLTGRRPFHAESHLRTLRQVCEQEPPPLRQLRPEVPETLVSVVSRCLRKRPEERYPSAAALANDLRQFLDSQTTVTRTVSPPRRRPYVWLGVGGALGLLAIAVALSALLPQGVLSEKAATPPTAPVTAETPNAELSVQVWSKDRAKLGLKVEDEQSGAQPVQIGERVQLLTHLGEPMYQYLIWIDPDGDATALYPWNDNDEGALDNDLTTPPVSEEPRREVRSPRREGKGYPVTGRGGQVAAVLLARRKPLPDTVKLDALFGGIKTKWSKLPPQAPFDVMVRGFDRGRPNETVSVTRGLESAVDIDDVLLQLRDRLSEHFEVIRTVGFAQVDRP